MGISLFFPPSKPNMKYIFPYIQTCVFKTDMCVRADIVRAVMITERSERKSTTRAVSMHTVHTCKYTLAHTTRCGVLSLCGPALGCGVKQEMCEPWRHVFMLAAVAHHQPEGKQTPAPLHLLSIALLSPPNPQRDLFSPRPLQDFFPRAAFPLRFAPFFPSALFFFYFSPLKRKLQLTEINEL